ncbi:hypothetical protein PVAND_000292 [Polypedilum vanderplanki]|uniref:Uncharacterized protein n=1 Tax=Polypedilum vanderplanki TaxID=319348 RepID=A0A9J6BJM9_POLVA|nr:hypothetical protein PVAND_000292 [Polypedilum vanderplanki]
MVRVDNFLFCLPIEIGARIFAYFDIILLFLYNCHMNLNFIISAKQNNCILEWSMKSLLLTGGYMSIITSYVFFLLMLSLTFAMGIEMKNADLMEPYHFVNFYLLTYKIITLIFAYAKIMEIDEFYLYIIMAMILMRIYNWIITFSIIKKYKPAKNHNIQQE